MELLAVPSTYASGRETLQRVATHVLARRRAVLCGKFGLRATPGGIGTPACGPDHEVVRIAGTRLVRELSGGTAHTSSVDLSTASLADAADLVEVSLDAEFEAGQDTAPLGPTADPLGVDADAAAVVAGWFAFAWATLDATLAELGPGADASVVQLWPEHFDAGCDVAVSADQRANLGASPGDGYSAQPYLYVGPWDSVRPGGPEYWNAPFGAVLAYEDLRAAHEPIATGVSFFVRGVDLLRSR